MKKTTKRKTPKKGPLKAQEPNYQLSERLLALDRAIAEFASPRARGIVGPGEAVAILKDVRSEILEEGLAFQEEGGPEDMGSDEWFIDAARLRHQREGSIEIDDGAVVSRGSDDGAYVMAWVWIALEEK